RLELWHHLQEALSEHNEDHCVSIHGHPPMLDQQRCRLVYAEGGDKPGGADKTLPPAEILPAIVAYVCRL
ncbi:MAG TPA: hypothetical protein VK500_01200, partial [Nitrospiraceae bacterium]|nr:hypothetical protein [Nitrospiraceae bacterium]